MFFNVSLMAVLAVSVVGVLQLHHLALFLKRVVTGVALLDEHPFFPDVLAVFEFVVAISASGFILIHVVLMA
jgi:hypothetical protein